MKNKLKIGLTILVLITSFLTYSHQTERPNVIIIVADDLGYGDLATYGNGVIKTPNLDKLAKEGMKMTHCYSSSPMCSPARAGLLTGRAPYRTGVYDWIAPDSTMFLPRIPTNPASHFRVVESESRFCPATGAPKRVFSDGGCGVGFHRSTAPPASS